MSALGRVLHHEERLFGALLAVQILMITALLVLILSPWYSEYFNRLMRDYLLESYRNSKVKEDSKEDLFKASKYSALTQRKFPDLELSEEIARLGDKGSGALKAQKNITSWSRSTKMPGFIRGLAREKAISLNLLLARKALKNAAYVKTKEYLSTAFDLIKIKPSNVLHSRTRFLNSFLEISAQLAEARGRKELALKLRSDQAQMDNQRFAQAFYTANGIDGFDIDFPMNLQVQSLMSDATKADAVDFNLLNKAIIACGDSSVFISNRVPIWQHALALAGEKNNIAIPLEICTQWEKSMSLNVPTRREEGILIASLMAPAMHSGSPHLAPLLLKRFADSLERDLLHPTEFRLIEFLPAGQTLINPSKNNAADIERDLDRIEKIALKNNLDDSRILSIKMAVLLALERFDEADKIERTLFSRPQSFSTDNATLFEANVRRRAWSLPPEKRVVYLEDALKKGHWSNEARLDFLLVQASCNEGDADKDGKWRATVAKIFRLVDSIGITKLSALLRLDLDEYRLRSLVHMRKLNEARQTYKQMSARYIGKDADWEYICNKQFSWLRAYPQHSPERFNDFQSGAYPTECFQDAVSLTRQVKGVKSEEYSLSLLFMAEHEFTKGKMDEARALCKQILDGWTPETSSAFIAARDLKDELDENEHEIARRKEIIGKQFSKSQVECLHSIYSSANRKKAKERTGKMLEKIREI